MPPWTQRRGSFRKALRDTMRRVTSDGTSSLPWCFRFAEATRAPLLLLGLGVAAAYLCSFVLFHNITGGLDGLRMGAQPFWRNPFGAMAFTYALGFGYLLIVVSHLMRFTSARLRDLSPVLTLSPREIAEFDSGLRKIEPWRLRITGIVGVGMLVALDIWFFAGVASNSRPQPWSWWVAFFLAQDFVYVWLTLAWAFLFAHALRFARLGERHTDLDLFDLQGMRPFTQLGLRLALMVLIGFALAMPSLAPFGMTPNVPVVVTYGGMMVCVPVVVAGILVMVPLRGVHRSIVRARGRRLKPFAPKLRESTRRYSPVTRSGRLLRR